MRREKRSVALAVALLILLATGSPSEVGAQRTGGKLLSYEQAFGSPPRGETSRAAGASDVTAALPSISGWLDDERYLESRTDPSNGRHKMFAVGAADGTASVYRDYDELQKYLPDGFNARTAVASTRDLTGLVYERDDDLYYFDVTAHRFQRLTATPAEEHTPRFSPDGKWIAYTRDHNLFAYDLQGGVERQYTTDGSETVYNGWAAWVYYEEILGRSSRYAAFWWSPDSSRLAFLRFDEARVPAFPLYHADGQHGILEHQRYPKAGDPNPLVEVGIVPVRGGDIVWADFDPAADHYLAWPSWTPDSRTLTVQWMNRGQDTIRLYNCDATTGKKSLILEEKQPSWVEFFEDLVYLKDGSGFLLRSNVDGWDHLYYYGPDGRLRRQLTSGNWRVTSIAGVDEAAGFAYFTGRPGKSWDAQFMRVRLDGTGLQQLTHGEGNHAARLSPGARYFIDSVSTITTPAARTLHRSDGVRLRELARARIAATGEYAWGKAELFTIPSGDGYDLPAFWVLPPDFDPARQYPVIFTVYGGPEAQRVTNSWPGLTPHYWAQRGIIPITVDNRGSGHFGKKGAAMMHRDLGKWEMADLIAAATWLRSKPFIAKDRIGITGSSYGGYTTLLALTSGASHFNFGQAVSPVSDWRLYDSVYTERYMDTPAENPDGYKTSAVLNWISRYTSGLRITHGTVDDNVHLQNSLQVVDWLTSNNKPFELMFYPGSRHDIRFLQQSHALQEQHDFWIRTLLSGKPLEPPTMAIRKFH